MSRWGAVFVEPDDFCTAFFEACSVNHALIPISPRDINPFVDLALASGEARARTGAVVRDTATKAFNILVQPGLQCCQCDDLPSKLAAKLSREKVDHAAFYFDADEITGAMRRSYIDQAIPVLFTKSEVNDVDFPTGMIAYADLLFAVQQRVALFMLVVFGSRAQFVRWDRSGAVVTQAFDYVEHWRFFCGVLGRIGHCSAAQLGFDPTATRVYDSDADFIIMDRAADVVNGVDHSERFLEDGALPPGEFEYVRKMFEDSITSGWPRYRVEVPDCQGHRKFLIGKPAFRHEGTVGRGTRGYVALDCDSGRFVWLKDAWRASDKFVRKEGDILADLNQAQVSNVPTLVCHGDIPGQATKTPDWCERKSRGSGSLSTPTSVSTRSSTTNVGSPSLCTSPKRKHDDEQTSTKPRGTKTGVSPLRLYQHYRLVVQEVAMSLDCFGYPQQLIQIFFDCVVAHYEAATKLEPEKCLLHRDISSGNILIYPRVLKNKNGIVFLQWRGLLADWEMAQPQYKGDALSKPTSQREQTGTWEYASVALLTPGSKFATLADELESFFHVLLYYAVRYVRSVNGDGEDAAKFLYRYFNTYSYFDPELRTYTCGPLKSLVIKTGRLTAGTWAPRFGNPLDELFEELLSWFAARYNVAYHDENKKQMPATPEPVETSDVDREIIDSVDEILAQFGPMDVSILKPPRGPSEEERDLARGLESHNRLVLALGAALYEDWPKETAEDQVPETWNRGNELPHPPSRNNRSKRRRTHKAKAA